MTQQEFDFDSWFDVLCTLLSDRDITFRDRDSVREDYDAGRDVFDVCDEIVAEYD